jgi:hypothetical protein
VFAVVFLRLALCDFTYDIHSSTAITIKTTEEPIDTSTNK